MAALQNTIFTKSAFKGNAVQARPISQPRLTAAAVVPIRAAQSLQGTVISRIGDKTAVVAVNNPQIHPIYLKRVNFTKKYVAHVEQECAVGDTVTLAPSRPLSKKIRFVVSEVTQKAK